jgi:hypothetical protein
MRIIGWYLIPIMEFHADGFKEQPEPSGREKVDALCEMAVIFGMPVEDAEKATLSELTKYLEPFTKLDCKDCANSRT